MPLIGQLIPRLIPEFIPGSCFAGSSLPPVSEKLIAWLKGPNVDNTTKREYINEYHFTQQNCTPDYILDNEGNQITDLLGDPIWFTLLETGWECEYLAPASGEDGHTELLAIDDGTLYTGSTPNVLTKAILAAISNDQMFFGYCSGKGLVIYSEVLTGQELLDAQSFVQCPGPPNLDFLVESNSMYIGAI